MTREYRLRAATAADFDFVFALHRAAMREYIEPIWGWHEDWQEEYQRRKYAPERYQIIVVEGHDAGVLVVESRADELYLGLIELRPEDQSQGIGTRIVEMLERAASERGVPLTLHVLKTNIAARRLYERLGFEIIEEEEVRYRMGCAPTKAGKPHQRAIDPHHRAPTQEEQ